MVCKKTTEIDSFIKNVIQEQQAISVDNSSTTNDFLKQDSAFRYKLLGRMKSDCEYFLKTGAEKHLWSGSVEEQISNMKLLFNSFSEDEKPEWLSLEDIDDFNSKMTKSKINDFVIEDSVPNNRKQIASNFVLDKLNAAGIKVITDKAEFDRILKNKKILQKMIESKEEPEKIEQQTQLVNGLIFNKPASFSEDSIIADFQKLNRALHFNANFEIQSKQLGEEVSVFPSLQVNMGLEYVTLLKKEPKKIIYHKMKLQY